MILPFTYALQAFLIIWNYIPVSIRLFISANLLLFLGCNLIKIAVEYVFK